MFPQHRRHTLGAMNRSMMASLRSWFERTSTGGPEGYKTWDDSNAAIADVTRWAWLPALSGVSIASAQAAGTHRSTAAGPQE